MTLPMNHSLTSTKVMNLTPLILNIMDRRIRKKAGCTNNQMLTLAAYLLTTTKKMILIIKTDK